MGDPEDFVQQPTPEEVHRVDVVLNEMLGGYPGAEKRIDVWLAEHRVRAERLATARLTRATWVLAFFTLALFLATVGLIVSTIAKG